MGFFSLVILLCCCLVQCITLEVDGSCNYQNGHFESITVHGSAIFTDVTVDQETVINGKLQANRSQLHALTVNGLAELASCTVCGTTKINGFLIANHTTFEQPISISSQRLTLSSCQTSSITMLETEGQHEPQIIALRNGTKVQGSINVKAGNGEIWLFAGSEITGQVTGATIIKTKGSLL